MSGISPSPVGYFTTAFKNAFFQFAHGFCGSFMGSRFVLVEFVKGAVRRGSNIWHHHVCPDFQCFFSSGGVNGLKGRGGCDINVRHEKPECRYHVNGQAQSFLKGKEQMAVFVQGVPSKAPCLPCRCPWIAGTASRLPDR